MGVHPEHAQLRQHSSRSNYSYFVVQQVAYVRGAAIHCVDSGIPTSFNSSGAGYSLIAAAAWMYVLFASPSIVRSKMVGRRFLFFRRWPRAVVYLPKRPILLPAVPMAALAQFNYSAASSGAVRAVRQGDGCALW